MRKLKLHQWIIIGMVLGLIIGLIINFSKGSMSEVAYREFLCGRDF